MVSDVVNRSELTYFMKLSLLLIFSGLILTFGLSSWGVTETSEARYAEIGYEMYETGDFLHPKLLGIGHYHKPPFTYWLTAIAYYIFGPSAFAARIFLQIAVLIQVLLVYNIAEVLFENAKTAFYAAIIYIGFPAVLIGSRALTTDIYLATWVLLAIYCWLSYAQSGEIPFLYFFYLALGFGFLTKGPVVLIAPLVVLIFYRNSTYFAGSTLIHHALGIFIFLLIAFSWFGYLYWQNPEFLDYFLFDHTVKRFATNNFGRNQPFWFYLVLVPLTSLPWFFITVKPLLKWKSNPRVIRMLLAWIFIPLLFFSLSRSKLILYTLPLYPAIALLAAHYWSAADINKTAWWRVFQLLALGIGIGLTILPLIDSKIHYSLVNHGYAWLVLMLAGLSFFWNKAPEIKLIYGSVILAAMLVLASNTFMANNPLLVHDQKNLAEAMSKQNHSNPVMVFDERLPSLAFHTQEPIISVAAGNPELDRETQFETNMTWQNCLIYADTLESESFFNSLIIVKDKEKSRQKFNSYHWPVMLVTTVDGWNIYIFKK